MDIDWKLLTQVRERHKAVAQELVAHERQVAEQREAQLRHAQQELQAQLDAKQQLWQNTVARQNDRISVAHLCATSAWSRSLDTHITQASETMGLAQQQAAQQQARLERSRQQLRAAAGDLEKAEQMRSRARTEQMRRLEAHFEHAAEEVAMQTWTTRRVR